MEEKRPAVKRLKKAVKPAKSKDNIFHTKQVADRQEAIDSKLSCFTAVSSANPS